MIIPNLGLCIGIGLLKLQDIISYVDMELSSNCHFFSSLKH